MSELLNLTTSELSIIVNALDDYVLAVCYRRGTYGEDIMLENQAHELLLRMDSIRVNIEAPVVKESTK